MLKVYLYQGCSTCKSAAKWLKSHQIAFEEKAIRETPPTVEELNQALKARGGDLRGLFNTSGQDYRALGLKDQLPSMTPQEAIQLLSQNGNLVKRPFALDAKKDLSLVGFKEAEWAAALSPS